MNNTGTVRLRPVRRPTVLSSSSSDSQRPRVLSLPPLTRYKRRSSTADEPAEDVRRLSVAGAEVRYRGERELRLDEGEVRGLELEPPVPAEGCGRGPLGAELGE